MQLNEISIRKVLTIELTSTVCIGFLLSLIALIFIPGDTGTIAIRKEIFIFIAGAVLGAMSTAVTMYFNRNDRANKNSASE